MPGSLNDDLDRQFGEQVRAARERAGVSQRRLATVLAAEYGLPWHQTAISKIEAGERSVRLGEAVAIATVLGVDLGVLVYGRGAAPEVLRAITEVAAVRDYAERRLAELHVELEPGPGTV